MRLSLYLDTCNVSSLFREWLGTAGVFDDDEASLVYSFSGQCLSPIVPAPKLSLSAGRGTIG